LDAFAAPFFPVKIRAYLTLKSMTVVVILLFACDVLFKLFVTMGPLPRPMILIEDVVRSPLFLVPYNVGMLVLMYLVIMAKPRSEHSYLRALCYGVMLAALLGECIVLFVPWRS
jgi:hypothetical protein